MPVIKIDLRQTVARRWFSKNGYPIVVLTNGRKAFEHRLVAERALGRRLKRTEIVHHIYGERSDTKHLVICSRTYHTELHRRCLARFGSWHLPKGNYAT
jgi:hypothetical protein